MKFWKYTPLDSVMVMFSVGQFVTTVFIAMHWEHWSMAWRIASLPVLLLMMTYNIIVVTHLFTHTRWFHSPLLNALVSMLNSINIGQSVQAYKLTHVRNHHRYNNDQQGPDGMTNDLSSTYQDGIGGEHANLPHYAFIGALSTLRDLGRGLGDVVRLWRVSEREHELVELCSKPPEKRAKEIRQLQLDRAAHFTGLCIFLAISWKWLLFCYLPAFYITLALVNIQNYYEHYGAAPQSRYADSVSYYGRLYNLLTFNDGYHQEHHLRPQSHWSTMPAVRREHSDKLDQVKRIISPVPAILGFLHRNRTTLHRRQSAQNASQNS